MPDAPPRPRKERKLHIWGQNLNRSLHAQIDFLHSLGRHRYDIALLQEPHFDFRGISRAGRAWRSVYPTAPTKDRQNFRSAMLINEHLPSDSWRQVAIPSPDITAIDLYGDFGTIRIINVYNDCNHNAAI
ncbi:hypothetical protein C8R47DRAFT_974048, partial [Mycena vitilis]